ncbi:hypothetical protein SprV_0702301500 [Sparganum proliferum]
MDPLPLVAEHCANSEHSFAFQNPKILGLGNDRVTRETIKAWQTGMDCIKRYVGLFEAYQALWTQLREQRGKRGLREYRNPNADGSIGDENAAALQPGSDECAIVTTAAAPTHPAGEQTDDRSNINGPGEGASFTTYPAGETTGGRGVEKKFAVRVSLPSAFVSLPYCPPHAPCRYAAATREACLQPRECSRPISAATPLIGWRTLEQRKAHTRAGSQNLEGGHRQQPALRACSRQLPTEPLCMRFPNSNGCLTQAVFPDF